MSSEHTTHRLARLRINARENWYRDLWLAANTALVGWVLIFALPSQVTQNRDAICALRHDLENRVASTERYLREHPNGAPQLGITAAQLRQTEDGQRRTIRALSAVSCEGR